MATSGEQTNRPPKKKARSTDIDSNVESSPKVELSVIVPVFNNETTLDPLIDRLIAVLEPIVGVFEMVFVDDGSSDASWAILERRASTDERVRPFALVRNFGGQAAACAALDLARGRRVVSIDADLENWPEDLPAVLEPLEHGYDMVAAYREDRGGPWLARRVPSQILNWYVRRKAGTTIRDIGCGVRAMDAKVVHDLAGEGEARRLLTPLLLRRAQNVTQVPIRFTAKQTPGGHSFATLLGVAIDYYLITAGRPFLLSGTLAVLAAMGGTATAILSSHVLEGIVVAGFGFLGALLSLVGEFAQRIYHLGQGIPFYELRANSPDASAKPAEP